MKVLFNTYTMAFQRPGGGEQVLLKILECLKNEAIQVDLFDPWNTKIEDYDIVHHFSLLEWEKFKDYKDFGAKLVVTPTAWPATDLKTITKEKVKTLWFETLHPNRPAATLSHYERFVDLFLPTTYLEQDLIQKRYKISPDKCKVIPNGVTPPQQILLEDNLFYQSHPQLNSENIILFSGSIRPNKNVDLLIKSCMKEGFPLIIMGDASAGHEEYARKCRELSDKSKSPIIWTGHIDYGSRTYDEIYCLSHCVCIPSNFETFCLAAAQASAIGKPVVIPDAGGTKAVFNEEATYLKEYNIEALSKAIKEALNTPQQDLQDLRKRFQDQYSWKNITTTLIDQYNQLTK